MHNRVISSRRLLFYTLFCAYICTGILSVLPGASLPLLAQHTHVPLDVAGFSFTLSALGFTVGVLIAGGLTGRLNSKYLLMIGLALMSLASMFMPWTPSFALLIVSQFTKGIGFGFIDVSINTVATLAFADSLGETLNNIHSSYGVGALVGPLLLSIALQFLNDALWAYLIGVVIGIITLVLLAGQVVPALPQRNERQQEQNPSVTPGIFRQSLLWFMALQIALYVGAEIGFGNWIVTAVSKSAAITLVFAAPAATAFFVGLTLGRLLGAQVLRRKMLSESQLLFVSIFGGTISGVVVAAFTGQIVVSLVASALVGLFYGPLFPGIMAIASRWFVHALGAVSSVMLVSTGAAGMVLPALMGVLIPLIGVNWVMAIPAAVCLLIAIPLSLAIWRQNHTLLLQSDMHTIEQASSATLPI
jgi:FHS family glucose/mannose:H+ symporter-like MFS transporter